MIAGVTGVIDDVVGAERCLLRPRWPTAVVHGYQVAQLPSVLQQVNAFQRDVTNPGSVDPLIAQYEACGH